MTALPSSSPWRLASEIFLRAIDLREDEREIFVQAECEGDLAVLAQVRSLLEAHEAEGPVDVLIDGLADEAGMLGAVREQLSTLAPLSLPRGAVLGQFEVLEKLGEGGSASVYRARRVTDEFEQEVALKVLSSAELTKDSRLRFDLERRIAASLDHPNIAKLIDGGIAEDGRPFFALELVEGQTIDVYCDEQELTVCERVRLVIEVAHAVQHAHRNLLVHRDLKPSNILIDVQGRVRLLDFGIAKPLDPRMTGAETQTGALMLTPRYASPEQFRGESVTTASDQYQLGLLLFELITGHCHHLLGGEDLDSMGRLIREIDTPAPSRLLASSSTGSSATAVATGERTVEEIARARGLGPGQLAQISRGDLDTIVLKALEKDATRRYPSVEALAEDLQRYLNDEPIRARPASPAYRLRKLLQRHRVASTVAIAGCLALVLGAGLAGWQAVRATRAERLARSEAATSDQVSKFLVELFSVADPEVARGGDLSASEILRRGRERIETQLHDQPLIRARLMEQIAVIHGKLGSYDEALPLAEQALVQRLDLLGEQDPRVAQSRLQLGRLLADAGDDSAAAQLLSDAADGFHRIEGAESPGGAEAVLEVARLEARRNALDRAEQLYNQSLGVFERAARAWSREGPGGPEWRAATGNRAAALAGLGSLHFQRTELREAEELQRRALTIREALYPEGDHPDVARSISDLGDTVGWQGRDTEAAPLLERAVDLTEKVYGGEHRRVAEVLNRLAALYGRMGRLEEAESAFRRSANIREEVFGAGHPETVAVQLNLGRVHLLQGELDEAEVGFRTARAAAASGLGEGHPLYGFARSELAAAFEALGRLNEARDEYAAALTVLEAALGADHARLAETLTGLAAVEVVLGRVDEAEMLYRRALRVQEAAFDGDTPALGKTLNGLGSLLQVRGDLDGAMALYRRTEAAWTSAYDSVHPAVGQVLSLQGRVELERGRIGAARELFRRALTIADQAHGAGHVEAIPALEGLAAVARAEGNERESAALLRQAGAIR